jgi:hypothetical protein
MSVFYFPVYMYWFYLGFRARSIFFFTASNPAIKNGGMIAASKKSILDLIPQKYIPKTILLPSPVNNKMIEDGMNKLGLNYPVIFKPDLGERGWKVEKIDNTQEANDYLSTFDGNLQIQAYIDLPFEAGVFYYRFPNEEKGTVSSIVVKELLFVLGDGLSTLKQLILNKPRARLQYEKLKLIWGEGFATIPTKGERVELQPIGNHNRGTAFLDGNHLINTQLISSFDAISKQIEGFYYGRYDVRCKDEESLKNGDVMIMELNGAASEPAHIYQSGYPILKAYKSLFHHWKVLYDISIFNHKKGVKYTPFKEGWNTLRNSARVAEQGI